MNDKQELALNAKVNARNQVHILVKGRIGSYQDAIKPFLGKKILLTNGTLADKVKKALPESIFEPFYQIRTNAESFGVYVSFRVNVISDVSSGRSEMAETSVCIGKVRDSILIELATIDLNQYCSAYTTGYVKQARIELDLAGKAFNNAEHKLMYFGQHDNF